MNRIVLVRAALAAAFLTALATSQGEQPKPAAGKAAAERPQEPMKEGDTTAARAAAKAAVEAEPDSLDAHDKFLRIVRGNGRPTPEQSAAVAKEIEAQYEQWTQRFPRSAGVAYGMAAFYSENDDPRAKPFFERAKKAAVEAIEANPDKLEAHDLFLRLARGKGRPTAEQTEALAKELETQYAEWRQRFPRSAGVAYGMGAFYSSHEDPRAKPFLERAVELDPKLAKVWQMLSIDAERWGDNEKSREYMHKAMEADPKSPDYAFYWASSWHDVDDAKWLAASLDVVKRFPDSDRGAQALYWLGERSRGDEQKIRFWEQCRRDFSPEKSSWSRSSMSELFEAYLRTDPQKAIELAGAMPPQGEGGRGDNWAGRLALAQRLVEVQKLVAEGKYAEAREPAKELVAGRFSSSAEMLDLLKAEVLAGAGEVQAAYDALCQRLAGKPEDRTRAALLGYGAKLGKQAGQVEADVWIARDKTARPAPEFDLQRYDSDATVSLRSLRGKVVFVTFWFPGCGPCRGEFPNFEHVVRKFQGKDLVYLGINGIRDQDGYVESFMRGTRYSFTPLRGEEQVTKAYKVGGYPENLLIDRDGRIVYAHFRTNGDSEIVLQRMIESLLARPQQSAADTAAPGPAKGDK